MLDLISTIQNRACSKDHGMDAKSWPFEEARKIVKRLNGAVPLKGYVLFETGYGPSGLPHIGTFGEVARTIMVQHAFRVLSDVPTRLFVFSDDMDGLRKVPDNVPNQQMLAEHLNEPLTTVPDPYEKFESFGHHNNAMLRSFLDSFGFEYEFQSATEHYKSGNFDAMLVSVLQHYDEIMDIMLPTLRDERRATYSPFLPICPQTHKVLQVHIDYVDPASGTIAYKHPETGAFVETPVTRGNCKLQWKVDWGGRWCVFGVDYEMSGKDLIPSFALSSKVCRILGGNPPENLSYELFLDQNGQKISKSKGNGLTIDEWLKYAPHESLAYYMFQSPQKAKRLYFDVIPRAVDEYVVMLAQFDSQESSKKVDNPVFHIHNGAPPSSENVLSFNVLLNLASVCGADNAGVMWGFVQKYMPGATPENANLLDKLIHHAVAYYHDFVKPNLRYRDPSEIEKTAIRELFDELQKVEAELSADELQCIVFEVGKKHPFDNLRQWFQGLYEVLLGNSEGPRMGSFIALFGVENMCQLINEKTKNKDVPAGEVRQCS
ncbi:MAG: lysine--tRNA ligase [Holosporales bacterium]|jgi:lysyl-tRNA synthetase class 1|nr:lysine--tRNA ligase [Holosporales bacterium]